jgi:hypothetical protein
MCTVEVLNHYTGVVRKYSGSIAVVIANLLQSFPWMQKRGQDIALDELIDSINSTQYYTARKL